MVREKSEPSDEERSRDANRTAQQGLVGEDQADADATNASDMVVAMRQSSKEGLGNAIAQSTQPTQPILVPTRGGD